MQYPYICPICITLYFKEINTVKNNFCYKNLYFNFRICNKCLNSSTTILTLLQDQNTIFLTKCKKFVELVDNNFKIIKNAQL